MTRTALVDQVGPSRCRLRAGSARSVGLVPVERCAAMLAAVRHRQIVHRASMCHSLLEKSNGSVSGRYPQVVFGNQP
jgi:hypothetical protein